MLQPLSSFDTESTALAPWLAAKFYIVIPLIIYPFTSESTVYPLTLLLIKSTHPILGLTLKLGQIRQRLLALPHNRLSYLLTAWFNTNLEKVRSHIQPIAICQSQHHLTEEIRVLGKLTYNRKYPPESVSPVYPTQVQP